MDKLFIERKAILTLDNGAKIEADITMPSPRKAMFREEIEKKFVDVVSLCWRILLSSMASV